MDFISRYAGTVKLRPDHKLVVQRAWEATSERVAGLRQLLRQVSEIAARAAKMPERSAGRA